MRTDTHMPGRRLLQATVTASASVLLLTGALVIDLQGRREDVDAARRLRVVGYGWEPPW